MQEDKDKPDEMYNSKPSPRSILVVEDEEHLRNLIQNALKPNYTVFTASSVIDAKYVLENSKIDIALVDIGLPESPGTDLLEEIVGRNLPTKVIMMTGNTQPETATELTKKGASDFISKPFGVEVLKSRVDSVYDSPIPERVDLNGGALINIVGERFGVPNLERRANDERWFRGEGSGGREQQFIDLERAVDLVLRPQVMVISEDPSQRRIIESMLWSTEKYNVFRAKDVVESKDYLPGAIDLMILTGNDSKYSRILESGFGINTLVLEDSQVPKMGPYTEEEMQSQNEFSLEHEIEIELKKRKVGSAIKAVRGQRVETFTHYTKKDPTNVNLYYQLAKAQIADKNYFDAKKSLNIALGLDSEHVDVWLALVDVLEKERDVDVNLVEQAYHKLKSMVDLTDALHESKKADTVMALAKTTAKLGKNSETIRAYRTIVELDPENLEAQFRLGISYIRNNQQEEAEGVFRGILEKFPKNELYAGLEFLSDYDSDFENTLHLAEESKNQVYGIVAKSWAHEFVIKMYDSQFASNAENEVANLINIYEKQDDFLLPSGTRLRVPRPVMFSRGEDYSLLVLERIEGKSAAEDFVNYGNREKLELLELMTDATTAIAESRSQTEGLVDVRSLRPNRTYGKNPKKVGFYTHRFLTKFVGQFEEFGGIETLSNRKKDKLVKLHRPINDGLMKVPDFFYSFYTDDNFRNFLRGDIPEQDEQDRALEFLEAYTSLNRPIGRKVKDLEEIFRLDLEGSDKRIMMLDHITSAEHELNNFGRQGDTNYIVRRAILGHIMIQTQNPDTAADIREVLASRHHDIKDRVRNTVRKYFPEHMEYLGQEFSLDDLEPLTRLCSAQRHLTVSGDKVRVVRICDDKINLFERSNPEIVRDYNQFMAMRKSETTQAFNDASAAASSSEEYVSAINIYAGLKKQLGESRKHLEGHLKKAKQALNATGNKDFLAELQKYYPI